MGSGFRCFEDYEVGQEGMTWSRTVGETAIDTFAYITGDYSMEHVDQHRGVGSAYGGRVAHGLLGSSLAVGMASFISPQIVGRGVPEAYLCGFEAVYRGAIKIGDTITIGWRVSEKTDDPVQAGFGLVKTTFQVINQEGTAVYEGSLVVKVRKQTAQDAVLQFRPGMPWDVEEFVLDPEKLYYLEDFPVGQGQLSGGRTITEADVVNFAGLTGDYAPLYVDDMFAGASVFGQRIAPPMLVWNVGLGLWMRDGDFVRAKVSPDAITWAGHLGDGASFHAPVKIGDTIRCIWRTESVRASRSKPNLGIIKIGLQILNQNDEAVQEGYNMMTRGIRNASA